MNDKDRIRLAEAVGVGPKHIDRASWESWVLRFWNPLEDANDDYAVLEFFRNGHEKINEFWDEIKWLSLYEYQIGDYARAALKVLKNE